MAEVLATWRQQPCSSVQRTIFPGGENSRLKGESNIIYHLDFLHSIPVPSLSCPPLSLLIFTYRMVFYSYIFRTVYNLVHVSFCNRVCESTLLYLDQILILYYSICFFLICTLLIVLSSLAHPVS